MAAIEYGSYYWCVVLNGKQGSEAEECVHLHADDLKIDSNGALTFRSAGRRPAGAEPKREEGSQEPKNSQGENPDTQNTKGDKAGAKEEKGEMIYMAFAPGSWRIVYAAKLQDGTPASVEHWKTANGRPSLGATVPPDSGATGYPTRA